MLVTSQLIVHIDCVWKGFSFNNGGILYKEGAFSRICTTFCVQCRGYVEVGCKQLLFKYFFDLFKMRNLNLLLLPLYRVGRKGEAKDAARGALKSPWWTLGCKYRVWILYLSIRLWFIFLSS